MASASKKNNLNDLALLQQTVKPTAPDTGKAALYAYTDGRLALEFPDASEYVFEGSTSPLTTKGDILTYSTTPTRLGVGANNTVLVADSAQATGNKWSAALTGLTLDNSVVGGVTPAAGTFTAGTFTTINITGSSTNQTVIVGNPVVGTTNNLADIQATYSGFPLAGAARGMRLALTGTLSADTTNAYQTYTANLTVDANGHAATANTHVANVSVATASGATGSVAIIAAFSALSRNTGAGTLTTAFDFIAQASTNAGTLTNKVVFNSAAQTAATNNTYILLGTSTPVSGNWTIHATTTNDSALAGKLKLGATTAPGTTLDVLTSDAVTAAVTNVVTIGHDSSGTPAANYGTGLLVQGKSSTTAGQSMHAIQAYYTVATHASRTTQVDFQAMDSAGTRTPISIGANGSASLLAFHAGTPIVRPANANEAAVVTTGAALASYGYTQSQADSIVTLVNAIRQCLVDYNLWKGAA